MATKQIGFMSVVCG